MFQRFRGCSDRKTWNFNNAGAYSLQSSFVARIMLQANERTYVFAQIETADGVKNAREIAQVNGVDGVLFGPNDYSCDVSVIGRWSAVQSKKYRARSRIRGNLLGS